MPVGQKSASDPAEPGLVVVDAVRIREQVQRLVWCSEDLAEIWHSTLYAKTATIRLRLACRAWERDSDANDCA